jgi:hypothetical protein
LKSKTLRVSTALALGILFAGACGGTAYESSSQPAHKSKAPSRAASAPDESPEKPAVKTAIAQPVSEMLPSEKMPATCFRRL